MTTIENAGEIKCPICKRLVDVKVVVGGVGDLHAGYLLATHGTIGRFGRIRKVCEGSGQMLMFYRPEPKEAADAAKDVEDAGERGGDGDS